MRSVTARAYAKLNLALAVIGRRSDGYHELRTIYQTIALADTLEIRMARGSWEIHLESSGFAVPAGKQNLAVRAVELLCRELKLRAQLSITLRKNIPPQSGLGGASSDAAAAMQAALVLIGKHLPAHRLLALAAKLGSDVPFFLFGGTALGVGRGEEIYPLPEGPRRYCVVLFPDVGVNTAEAYRLLRAPRLTSSAARHRVELFCGSANQDAWNKLGNDFEPLVFSRIPQLQQAKQALLDSGATQAALSGSGSAVFGLFAQPSTARSATQRLRAPGQRVFLTRTISRREYQARLSPG